MPLSSYRRQDTEIEIALWPRGSFSHEYFLLLMERYYLQIYYRRDLLVQAGAVRCLENQAP
jgi:hypothetical protein